MSSLFTPSAFPLIFIIENKVSRLKTLVTNYFRYTTCQMWLPLIAYVSVVSSYLNFFKHWGCDLLLSADDGQIKRILEIMITIRDGEILHIMHRKQLRVDGRLTGCETGDIIIIIKTITSPMLKEVKIGRYNTYISNQGQPHLTSYHQLLTVSCA
jgi:hypothetical protein